MGRRQNTFTLKGVHRVWRRGQQATVGLNHQSSLGTTNSFTRRVTLDWQTWQRGISADRIAVLMVVATFAILLAPALIGQTRFVAGDLALRQAPWSENYDSTGATLLPLSDTIDSVVPAVHQQRERLRRGDFPEWDPDQIGGTELMTVPNIGTLHPVRWPLLLLGVERGAPWVKLAELLFATFGIWAFGRRIGLTGLAGVFGGAVFAMSGFTVAWTNWPQSTVASTIPALFWVSERLFQKRDGVSVALMSIVVAMLLAGGFPAVALHGMYAVTCYLAMRWLGVHVCSHRQAEKVPQATWRYLGKAARSLLQTGLLFAGAVLLGAMVIAAQLVPFLDFFRHQDFSYRAGYGSVPLATKLLATAAIPNAFGDPVTSRWYGPLNPIETHSFLGIVPLLLLVVGLIFPARHVRFEVRAFFYGLAAIVTVMIFLGSPLLDLARMLPGMDSSPIGRLRGLWGFGLAVSAAIGLDGLLSGAKASGRQLAVLGTVTSLLAVGYGLAVGELWRTSQAQGQSSEFGRSALLATILVTVGALVVLLHALGRGSSRTVGLSLLTLALVQSAAFAWQFWPHVEPDRFLPETEAHRMLATVQGHDRVGSHHHALGSGISSYFGLRTATGRGFHSPQWRELLERADALMLSSTFSVLRLDTDQALQSPVLDRMAVRYVALPYSVPPPGGRVEVSRLDRLETLDIGTIYAVSVPSSPIRAIGVHLDVQRTATVDQALIVRVTVGDSEGNEISSQRRIRAATADEGPIFIPVALDSGIWGETFSRDDLRIELETEGGVGGSSIGVDDNGEPALTLIVPRDDDGLQLLATPDVSIMERTTALPRLRWASKAVVVQDQTERLDTLADGAPSDTVVLADIPEQAVTGGGSAEVTNFDESDPDHLKVDIESNGNGWLTLADARPDFWQARVDDQPVELLEADHAMMAVAVGPGKHRIEFVHGTAAEPLGRQLSLVGVLVVAGILGWSLVVAPALRARSATR